MVEKDHFKTATGSCTAGFWQTLAGIGYQFDWGNIKLVYRHLSYEMDDGKLLQDLTVSGPVLGVGFQF